MVAEALPLVRQHPRNLLGLNQNPRLGVSARSIGRMLLNDKENKCCTYALGPAATEQRGLNPSDRSPKVLKAIHYNDLLTQVAESPWSSGAVASTS